MPGGSCRAILFLYYRYFVDIVPVQGRVVPSRRPSPASPLRESPSCPPSLISPIWQGYRVLPCRWRQECHYTPFRQAPCVFPVPPPSRRCGRPPLSAGHGCGRRQVRSDSRFLFYLLLPVSLLLFCPLYLLPSIPSGPHFPLQCRVGRMHRQSRRWLSSVSPDVPLRTV